MTVPKIDSYQFGEIVIDGQPYSKDLIIFPEGVSPNWWREQGHSLGIADLQEVRTNTPQVLIIGTGAYGRMQVPQSTLSTIQNENIQVIILESQAACQRYNELSEEKNVALAIHLTC